MTASEPSLSIDRLATLLVDGPSEEVAAYLGRFESAPADERTAAVRAVRDVAREQPGSCVDVVPELTAFLTDDERAVRLTTANALVVIAESEPDSIVPVVSSLAARLADETEFYYVRARCAEALGYVALEHPGDVTAPDLLADLRLGLVYDKPEVAKKLSKALEYVAIGDPQRLRHRVPTLAGHLSDERAVVRYHLTTALVAVGCEYPSHLEEGIAELRARLDDEAAVVRGRAAEALGLFAGTATDAESLPEAALAALADGEEVFVSERARFALDSIRNGAVSGGVSGEVGTLDGVRATSAAAVDTLTSTANVECSGCGLELSTVGPPFCPRCGEPQ